MGKDAIIRIRIMKKNTAADSATRLRWFKEARFGMFVH
jgi:hypothetical protein